MRSGARPFRQRHPHRVASIGAPLSDGLVTLPGAKNPITIPTALNEDRAAKEVALSGTNPQPV